MEKELMKFSLETHDRHGTYITQNNVCHVKYVKQVRYICKKNT